MTCYTLQQPGKAWEGMIRGGIVEFGGAGRAAKAICLSYIMFSTCVGAICSQRIRSSSWPRACTGLHQADD